MPRVHLNQTNFTAGEFDPSMLGRTDIERYPNAVKQMLNAYVCVQGGCKRRPGSVFAGETKNSAQRSVFLPFVFNRDQAYALEFGDNYMRVLLADGSEVESSPGVPYEISTPYDVSIVREIRFAQRADTMFLFHKSVPVQRLRRFADDYWDLSPAPWVIEPYTEQGHELAANLTLSNATVGTGRTVTASSGVFLAADVGRDIVSSAGLATITGYGSSTSVTADIVVGFPSTSIASGDWVLEGSPQTTCTPSAATPEGKIINLTLSAAGWRSSDAGKFVVINGGIVKLTSVASSTVVSGRILRVLDSTAGAEPLSWTLESSMFGGKNGYPSTGCLHEQRLIMGGIPGFPQHVIGTETGNVLSCLLATDDSDAFAFPIAGATEIRHLASVKDLIALDYSGEFVLQGGVEKPITPTNVTVKNQSAHGSSQVPPVRIGNELYFSQRAGRKVRAFAYRFSEDVFDAPDMTKLALRATESGFVQLAYQQEPNSQLLGVRNDGLIANCTIDRSEQIVGWSRYSTDGAYESVITIPYGDEDRVFVIVRRTINGVTKRYREYFDPATMTDCCLTGESVGGDTVWSGFDHLEGKTVKAKADGVPMPDLVVTGGAITLPRKAYKLEVGLGFTPSITLLPVEFPTGSGTAQGAQHRNGELRIRFLDTIGCTVNSKEQLHFRTFGNGVLDAPIEPFSGDKVVNLLGWEKNGTEITIEQPQPLPWHILSVVRRVTVND